MLAGARSRIRLASHTRAVAGAHENQFERGVAERACDAWRGKGAPGQSTALHLRGQRCALTALALQAAPALASRPLARRSRSTGSPASGPACSVLQPAAELASFASLTALGQWRRVSSRSALARAAASPALLGAPQARRGLSGHAFAGTTVARIECNTREESSRQAMPAGGDLWSGEKRRAAVGARSALRELTRRSCLSAASEANEASSAPRLRIEHRSEVGATRRPRNHEPAAGTAWRDAAALRLKTHTPTRTPIPRTSFTATAFDASRAVQSAVERLK